MALRIKMIGEIIEYLRQQLDDEIRAYDNDLVISEKIYRLSIILDYFVIEYMKLQQKRRTILFLVQ